jgi:uncharacterized Fe-S radical SAM superfamily protein PflX
MVAVGISHIICIQLLYAQRLECIAGFLVEQYEEYVGQRKKMKAVLVKGAEKKLYSDLWLKEEKENSKPLHKFTTRFHVLSDLFNRNMRNCGCCRIRCNQKPLTAACSPAAGQP